MHDFLVWSFTALFTAGFIAFVASVISDRADEINQEAYLNELRDYHHRTRRQAGRAHQREDARHEKRG